MLSKADIKQLHALQQNKFRRKYGQFLAEGSINVLDFMGGALKIVQLFATEGWIASHQKELSGLTYESVNRQEMEKISALKNPSEVLAVVEKPEYQLPDIGAIDSYVLALDDIKDPGNLGTIIRTADWFGIHDVVCSPETVDVFNPKVVQATMGSLARVRVHYTDLAAWLTGKPEELKVFGAVLHGNDIRKAEKPGKGILLIGSEAHGISQVLHPMIDEPVRIPAISGSGAESLNAAVATALVCYKFVMQG
ncbi:MAG: tRNA/rRNA methyltransferase [bacterium]|nr:MAG: tRNA/rRNA methyltransferase [bacterium]